MVFVWCVCVVCGVCVCGVCMVCVWCVCGVCACVCRSYSKLYRIHFKYSAVSQCVACYDIYVILKCKPGVATTWLAGLMLLSPSLDAYKPGL
jgi:hypothetical protein